ncbi:hypothetical protein QJU96_04550 [Pasteurella skyensis]|uniref:Uncharacterized protein n=1 Tax=Phocoenobacter skyensis TaxID=97481 RepID=A0AAJ6P2E5_9PAST|nr:hypothetical protein [Pasteurella skyensis]MDP8170558.1 hypothetical protein [Pasteurella skyensis]MDP8174615.1 hypothetical protein [Pasteurella skyensis]
MLNSNMTLNEILNTLQTFEDLGNETNCDIEVLEVFPTLLEALSEHFYSQNKEEDFKNLKFSIQNLAFLEKIYIEYLTKRYSNFNDKIGSVSRSADRIAKVVNNG